MSNAQYDFLSVLDEADECATKINALCDVLLRDDIDASYRYALTYRLCDLMDRAANVAEVLGLHYEQDEANPSAARLMAAAKRTAELDEQNCLTEIIGEDYG